jgi:hypothetical protein
MTSVACVIGPNVNIFFSFQNWKFLNLVVWTHWGLNWFFLLNPIFAIFLEFQEQNSPKNQYLSHLRFEICEIKFLKSNSSRAFQQHQEWPQIPTQFSVSVLFKFYWANGSIINSFHTVAPNNLKPSWCTLLIKSFLKIPRTRHKAPWFGRSQHDKQNKTNYFVP